MGPQHTEYEKRCEYMSTNPKPTLQRVSRHGDAKAPIDSRKSKVDGRNKVEMTGVTRAISC